MIGLLVGGEGSGATRPQTDNFCIYVSRTVIAANGTPIRRVQYYTLPTIDFGVNAGLIPKPCSLIRTRENYNINIHGIYTYCVRRVCTLCKKKIIPLADMIVCNPFLFFSNFNSVSRFSCTPNIMFYARCTIILLRDIVHSWCSLYAVLKG